MDLARQRLARLVFPMHEYQWRMIGNPAVPIDEPTLVGVCRKTTDRVALRVGADVTAVDSNPTRSVHKTAPDGSFCLVTDKDNVCLRTFEPMAKVVEDAAGVRHAAA